MPDEIAEFYCTCLYAQRAVEEVHQRNFTNIFPSFLMGTGGAPIDPVNPCLILMVARDNIVQDTINQLSKQAQMDFKKPLKVRRNLVILHDKLLINICYFKKNFNADDVIPFIRSSSEPSNFSSKYCLCSVPLETKS